MDNRCIVTGKDKSGKSVVVSNSPVTGTTVAALPGYEFCRVWGNDSVSQLPADGTPTPQPRYFPPKHGFRFGFFTIPPQSANQEIAPTAAHMEELAQKLPGLFDVVEPDSPGMHTTDTVDFDVVISGEVVLELDDGAEVVLKAGDCVVQNGTRHAWHNRSSQVAVLACCLIGAERKG
ncbi:MAG: cupin domain-containing protein [Terriglobales bacterium]